MRHRRGDFAHGNETARGDQLAFQLFGLAAKFIFASAQGLFGASPLLDLFLRRLVDVRIIDRDSGLGSDTRDDALGTLGKNIDVGVSEKKPADHFTRARHYWRGKITAHWQVAFRHAFVGPVMAVARVLGNIGDANQSFASKRRREDRCIARRAKFFKSLARRA